MERKIGEIFNIDNEWYQVVKSNGECCKGCAFYEKGCKAKYADVGSCGTSREDWTQVIFKKLEKVGEPYRRWLSPFNNVMVQRYRLYGRNVIMPDEPIMLLEPNYKNSVEIEIKQIKEDMEDLDKIKVRDYTKVEELNVMEENKLNLKPFDIQKAREGKPVCTRDGRKARIICFDFRISVGICMIAAIECGKTETIFYYDLDGKCRGEGNNKYDLMMLSEKKEGWVNVMEGTAGKVYVGNNIYRTEDEAKEGASRFTSKLIANVPIEWEE